MIKIKGFYFYSLWWVSRHENGRLIQNLNDVQPTLKELWALEFYK